MPYTGYIVGVAALVAVLLLNQLVFRHRWRSYPTREEYLSVHPDCDRTPDILCTRCGSKAASAGVLGRGWVWRCTWCETELFRDDALG
jgi:hypothetical protein